MAVIDYVGPSSEFQIEHREVHLKQMDHAQNDPTCMPYVFVGVSGAFAGTCSEWEIYCNATLFLNQDHSDLKAYITKLCN